MNIPQLAKQEEVKDFRISNVPSSLSPFLTAVGIVRTKFHLATKHLQNTFVEMFPFPRILKCIDYAASQSTNSMENESEDTVGSFP